jgi:hypothetical protein
VRDPAEWIGGHVDISPAGCWLWRQLDRHGYGKIWKLKDVAHSALAHRLVYRSLVGEIPDGLQVDHLCLVRNCVNPDHMELVTTQENTRRIGRGVPTSCLRGHALHEDKNGKRRCRTCHNERRRAQRAAKIGAGRVAPPDATALARVPGRVETPAQVSAPGTLA